MTVFYTSEERSPFHQQSRQAVRTAQLKADEADRVLESRGETVAVKSSVESGVAFLVKTDSSWAWEHGTFPSSLLAPGTSAPDDPDLTARRLEISFMREKLYPLHKTVDCMEKLTLVGRDVVHGQSGNRRVHGGQRSLNSLFIACAGLVALSRINLLAENGEEPDGFDHCDISLNNIMVDGSGRGRVIDFDLARPNNEGMVPATLCVRGSRLPPPFFPHCTCAHLTSLPSHHSSPHCSCDLLGRGATAGDSALFASDPAQQPEGVPTLLPPSD